jgi:hypothetical protein
VWLKRPGSIAALLTVAGMLSLGGHLVRERSHASAPIAAAAASDNTPAAQSPHGTGSHANLGSAALAARADVAAKSVEYTNSMQAEAATPASLTAVLSGDDYNAKERALAAAVAQRDPAALATLQAVDLTTDPEAAPAIISSLAKLGKDAAPADRARTVKTLSSWLNAESKRPEADAAGNVVNVVEALGHVGGRDAALALAAALDSGRLDLSVETLAVQQIGDIGDSVARDAVVRFASRVGQDRPGERREGFQAELVTEALAAAKATLAKLS